MAPPLHAPDGAAYALDPVALAKLAELDPGGRSRLVGRVLETFVASALRLRPRLDAGRRSGTSEDVRMVAHTLKSSSASVGALALSRCCAAIEAAIRADRPDALAEALAEFDPALDATLRSIRDWLKAAP